MSRLTVWYDSASILLPRGETGGVYPFDGVGRYHIYTFWDVITQF